MEQGSKRSFGQWWEQLQPNKTVVAWASIASVAATIAVGFTWGGWVTGGTAHQMGEEARADLAAVVCVDNFLAGRNSNAQLAELQDINSSYQRRQFVEAGGWAVMPDMEAVDRRTADQCARGLAALEMDSTASTARGMTVSE